MDASEYGVIRLSERTSHPVFPATPYCVTSTFLNFDKYEVD